MKLNQPQDYELILLPGGAYELRNSDGITKFTSPASVRGIGKLYTLSNSRRLLYVGIAQQPMSSRLNYGFKANGNTVHWIDGASVSGEALNCVL